MKIVSALVFSLAVSLDSIDLSSQSESTPNSDPVPEDPRSANSNPPERHRSRTSSYPSPARTTESSVRARSRSPLAETHSLRLTVRRPLPPEFPVRVRSTPLRTTRSSLRVLGCSLQQLQFIRLIPKTNLNRRFEIRRYTFPLSERMRLKRGGHLICPMPTEEQSVLSTSSGEIFAIVEDENTLHGIYAIRNEYHYLYEKRVKVNMNSGELVDMMSEETHEAPLGEFCPIAKNFKIVVVDGFVPERHRNS